MWQRSVWGAPRGRLSLLRSYTGFRSVQSDRWSVQTIYQRPSDPSLPPLPETLQTTGWIQTVRHSKACSFVELNDGTTHQNLQIVIDSDKLDKDQKSQLLTGAALHIEGRVVYFQHRKTNKQIPEIHCDNFQVVGASTESYPLQKKYHTREFLREIPHLRPRTRRFGAVMRTRSRASLALQKFMAEQNFFQIHTPIITSSDCEGSGDLFTLTTATDDKTKLFFNKPAFLGVSGQLHAEAFACAMSQVYTFGPTFRAEQSQTQQHLAEFWMLEPEMAHANLQDCVDLTRNMIVGTTKALMEDAPEDLQFLLESAQAEFQRQAKEKQHTSYADTLAFTEKTLDYLSDPEAYHVISYDEAVQLLSKHTSALSTPVDYQEGLTREHELYLVHYIFEGRPVFVLHYPWEQKAFYMKRSSLSSSTAACMDLLVPIVGEVAGGSEREDDLDVLQRNMDHKGIGKGGEYEWYLDLRRYGSVPHAGFGLGFERYLQLVTNTRNIRDVVAMPRAYQHCSL